MENKKIIRQPAEFVKGHSLDYPSSSLSGCPISKSCIICGKKIIKKKRRSLKDYSNQKYCSSLCYQKTLVNRVVSPETRRKISEKQKGKKIPEWQKKLISKINKGRIGYWKGKKLSKKFCDEKSKFMKGKYLGSKHWHWKGGRLSAGGGYIKVWAKGHPNAVGNYVLEHRFVMSKMLGRALEKGEFVHHRNANRSDNRPENLQLVTGCNHKGELQCPYCKKLFFVR